MSSFPTILHHPAFERIGWTLLHFIWEGAAVAVLLAVAIRLLARAGAGLRYWICCAAMALLALSPVITFILLPSHGASLPANVAVHAIPLSTNTLPMPIPLAIDSTVIPEPTLGIRPRTFLQPTIPSLVFVWMVGVAGLSLWHLAGWMQVRRLKRRRTRPLDQAWQTRLTRLAHRMNLRRPVVFLESIALQVPAVVGWLRPVVLIPASALVGLTPRQLDAIIAHELAHIRRHDYLVNILQVIAETLLFYHPATWWISRQVRLERENCCDDLAVDLCGDRLLYAQSLATLEELRSMSTQLALSARGGLLLRRIQRLLAPSSSHPRPRLWPSAIALAALACLLLPSTAPRLRAADAKPSDLPTSQPIPSAILPEDLVVVPTEYVIGRNDLITVSIYDLVNQGVEKVRAARVSDTGMISLPMLNTPIKAAGLTELQLQKAITEAYREAALLPNAQVSVTVNEARQRMFTVLGNVQRSGAYPLQLSEFTLIDALAAAGGLNPGSDKICIIRDVTKQEKPKGERQEGGEKRVIEIPAHELLAGNLRYNLVVRSGDRIVVPEPATPPFTQPVASRESQAICYLGGAVKAPGACQLRPEGETLRQLIVSARGLDPSLQGEPAIEMIRREGNVEFRLGRPIPLRRLMDGSVADIPLKNNDMVIIVALPKSDPPATQPKGE